MSPPVHATQQDRVSVSDLTDRQASGDRGLRTALWLAGQGFFVMPLAPGTKVPPANCRRCTPPKADRPNPAYIPHAVEECRCIAAGGHCHGVRAATTSTELISRWWAEDPRFGVGVACGPSGLLILDVDDHQDAERPTDGAYLPGVDLSGREVEFGSGWDTIATLAEVRNAGLPWLEPPTLAVLTAGGGLQAWFRVEEEGWSPHAGLLGWQLDVRAGHSYGIAPGTVVRGGEYRALGDCRTVGPLPYWLEVDLKRTGHYRAPEPERPRRTARQLLATLGEPKGPAYVQAAVRGELDLVAAAKTGTRNETLFRAGLALGRFVPAGLLSEAEAERLLIEAGKNIGLPEAEARSAATSGLRAGVRKGVRA